ncbi:uncharacterized protein LOC105194931 [Solenopsis invicta]|uniref:uncharacterized protein LOC105194931 n=1 Tax=Solenopsis invicta TaxID=13686 RepID=UPI00193DCA05|nr:uncharacterized protein LOC105194931 [Solenopsis invicta]
MRECRSQSVNVELWFLLVPNCTRIMLIVNIILFTSTICIATSAVPSTGASVTSATSAKSKRVVVDPGHNIRNNQEQFRGTQTTPRIPSPQDINLRSSPRYGNAKATDAHQRASYAGANHGPGSHAYGSVPKRQLSYVSPPIRQLESHRNNLLAPYFSILNNPDAYKAARSVEKPLDASKSIVSQSLEKLQGLYSPSYNAFQQNKPIELSGFSNFEFPSYGKLVSQGVSSPTVQAPVFKMSYSLPKIADYAQMYTPSISTASGVTPLSEKTIQGPGQKEATVDVNGKKISVPILQLQSNLDFSGALPAFDSQPFLLSANYPIESDMGFKFGSGPKFNMALQSSNVSPFSSPLSSFQGQVVPIQTGSPQFSQYKGASVEAYPLANNAAKAQGNYESLYSQPQLHFGNDHNGNVQPVTRQNTVQTPSVSTQGILNDVELINRKNPEPHTPQPDDDDADDEDRDDKRYKNPDKEHDHSSEDDDVERRPRKYFKASPTESDFEPSTTYPFKEYDERFGKHRAQSDDDDDDDDFEDKPYSSYKNYSSSDNDDDDEEEEDPSSEGYRAEYTESSKPSRDSYEEDEEEEEESRKQEKRKEANEGSYEVEPKRSKYYQKDFEQEFEESYREELPKEEYVHVKEVPEIDSYISPSPNRQQKNNSQSRVKHVQSKEPKNQESRIVRKNRKVPKTDFKDSTAHSSDVSWAKRTPKVIYEEFFGYKPGTGRYSKRSKTEKFSAKKTPKDDNDNDIRAAKYYKFKNSKTPSEYNSKDKDPYFSVKLNKNLSSEKTIPEKTVPRSIVKQLSDQSDEASFYKPSVSSGRMRSLTNAEIFRDLTGI